jgi:aldose sugar dehydrogenase
MKRTWLLALFMATPALAQMNAGGLAPTEDKPFAVTKVAEFNLPWRMAFLPDGRILLTEKGGKVFIATQQGAKTEVSGVPPVQFGGQNGLLGIYLSPTYAKDKAIYLTYSEPGEDAATSSLALARATLKIDKDVASLDKLRSSGAIRSRARAASSAPPSPSRPTASFFT